MKHKSRKQKSAEYKEKYSEIPTDLEERLEYMCDMYNVSESKYQEILDKKNNMMNNLRYYDFNIVLYEEPEGTPRSRFRIITRKNIAAAAMANPQYVHVYSPNAHDDHVYMKRLMGDDLLQLNSLIYTPCILEHVTYFRTPSSFNVTDKFLAEIGIIREWKKPDWDNIGKKYSDMYNANVWLDDAFVIDGRVRKFFSILPRVEIKLRYLNTLYNKPHYNSIVNRVDSERITTSIMYMDRYGNIVGGNNNGKDN